MKKSTEELEQLVTTLKAQLDFAKRSELNLVERITNLGRENDQLTRRLETKQKRDTEAIQQATREEMRAARTERNNKNAPRAGRLKRLEEQVEQKAQQLAEERLATERANVLQLTSELTAAHDRIVTLSQELVVLESSKQETVQHKDTVISSLQQQMADMRQAVAVEVANSIDKVDGLTKKVEEMQKTIAFMKVAEQDLVNRHRETAEALKEEKEAHASTRLRFAQMASAQRIKAIQDKQTG